MSRLGTTTLTVDESQLRVLRIAIEHASENEAFSREEDEIADRLYNRILSALDRLEDGA